jgi:Domain of unknown function (DUF1996)
MNPARVVLLVSILAAATTVASAALAGSGPAERRASGMAQLRGVNFVSACGFSHRAPDDPIVSPRRPGSSHDHSFVGNLTTGAFSTMKSLLSAATTCRRADDTAAYWAPTLFVDGHPVEPAGATIYYRRRTLAAVQAFPPGFKMIAGDAGARSPQRRRVTFWNCGVLGGVAPSSTAPTCPAGRARSLRLHITFPNCWDGQSLDSRDHQSHVAYSMRGICPRTHPVAVPAISLIFRYPSARGARIELASGGQYSAHADFFNAWKQEGLTKLVEECLNALRHCGRGS